MKVSVILPVYNGERFLRQAIDSVLNQTCRPLELIAVDDGSTDASRGILAGYGPEIAVYAQTNAGVAAARNAGARLASGALIAFLDQDDIWYPHKLERQHEVVAAAADAAFVYSDFDLIDGRGRVTRRRALAAMKAQWMRPFIGGHLHPYPSTVLMKRSLFLEAGGFDRGFRENMHEDVELWVRLHDRIPFTFVAEPLIQYRWDHEDRRKKKRSVEVDCHNYAHLYVRLHARFYGDPSKKEALEWILSAVQAYRGKEFALRGEFQEARCCFREARRLHPSGKRNRWRYIRTLFPSTLRPLLFPR